MGYAYQFPNADDKVVWSDGRRVGRLLVDSDQQCYSACRRSLLAVFRGHGVGTRLIGELISEGRPKGVPLRLHVRGGNPAARLYERLGFVATGGDGLNNCYRNPAARAECSSWATPTTKQSSCHTDHRRRHDAAYRFRRSESYLLRGETIKRNGGQRRDRTADAGLFRAAMIGN
jgi:Acetyltransferase (GNAT) domain